MYTGLQHLHSGLAYLVLLALLISAVVFLIKRGSASSFSAGDKRLALIALILTHLQLVIGLVLYFIGPKGYAFFEADNVMQNETMRLYAVEHISVNIIGIILVTIGYSRAKRSTKVRKKFGSLGWFYLIGLVLILSRIPWEAWLGV